MQTVAFLLTVAVVFVNGWTDAPNAIAGCIATRAISPKKAVALSAVCNFLGVWVMTRLHSGVAQTVTQIAAIDPSTPRGSAALCGALTAIVVWSVAAWGFGIPTSESHGLLAGLAGAGLAVQGNLSNVDAGAWQKVFFGLFGSVLLGFFFGWASTKTVEWLFQNANRPRWNRFWDAAQVMAGGAMSFMHGAQDGQKFLGLLLLLLSAQGSSPPLWAILLCGGGMAAGTSVGGYKIIKTVGMDMVHLQKYQGFCADTGAAASLFLATLFGWPVSTTHTKTTAIMGAGAATGRRGLHWQTVQSMLLAWVFTFPGCAGIGYFSAKLCMYIGG